MLPYVATGTLQICLRLRTLRRGGENELPRWNQSNHLNPYKENALAACVRERRDGGKPVGELLALKMEDEICEPGNEDRL